MLKTDRALPSQKGMSFTILSYCNEKNTVSRLALLFLVSVAISTQAGFLAEAKVSGECYNCHTMHNSQNGSSLSAEPNENITVSRCVTCHSSNTDDTIVTVGGSRIPIVLNTGGYPTKPLAGGNFYYTTMQGATDANGYDYQSYGHNVWGISGIDTDITSATSAPGHRAAIECGGSCHRSLAFEPVSWRPPAGINMPTRGGCQGCHYRTYHHRDTDAYRFLQSHSGWAEGVEDPDWEQTPTLATSNKYKGSDGSGPIYENHTISAYCGGCHQLFHKQDPADIFGKDGTGFGSPWLRHPTDFLLPTTGEYASYDPTTTYNNMAPVAYTDPENPTRETAVVMCLSCHRAHGSEYPDMLRWDYRACETGEDDTACGCFTCHSSKDAG